MASNPLQDALRKRQQEIERENRRDPAPIVRTPPPPPPSLERGVKTIERDNDRRRREARASRVRQRVDLRADQRRADAEAQRAAREAEAAARQARIEARTQRILQRASKRSEKLQARLDKIEAANKAAQADIDRQLAVLKVQQEAALAGGNAAAVNNLSKQVNILANRKVELDRALIDKKQGMARFYGATKLGLATVGAHEKLSPASKRARARGAAQPDSVHALAIKIPALNQMLLNPIGSGQPGRSEQLREASRGVHSYYMEHPEEYNPEVTAFLSDEVGRQTRTLVTTNEEPLNELTRLNEIAKSAKRGSKRQLQAVRSIVKLIESENLDAVLKDLRFMYGAPVKTNVKGQPKKRKSQGFLTEFVNDSERVYDLAVAKQNEIMFGTGLAGAMRGFVAKGTAATWYAVAESTRKDIYDPLTGNVRKQTLQERLVEMSARGGPTEFEAKEAGQAITLDWKAEALRWSEDPALKHLSEALVAGGIENNADLTGGLNEQKINRDIVPMAVDGAMVDWQAANPQPAGYEEGIFDVSRYGQDEFGQFFLLADGTLVRPGMPLPAGHPEPMWGALPAGAGAVANPVYVDLSDPDALAKIEAQPVMQYDLASAYRLAVAQMTTAQRQSYEDQVRAALRVPDPGFAGDIMNVPVLGPVMEAGGAVYGTFATIADLAFRGDLGLTAITEAEYEPLFEREEEKYKGWIVMDISETPQAKALAPILGMDHMMVAYENEEEAAAGRGVFTGYMHVGGVGNLMGGFVIELSGDMTTPALEREQEVAAEAAKALDTGDFWLYGRTVGVNTIVQAGNLSGWVNFAAQMFYDPTNFIPFAAIGKAGLRGVRAAVAAGKVPAGSPIARLGNMVDAMRGELHISAAAIELSEINKFIKALPIDANDVEKTAAFRAALANMDPKLTGEAAAQSFVDELLKATGLAKIGFDPVQLRHWASAEFEKVLLQRQWIIHSKTEDVALTLSKLEKEVADAVAAQKAISADVAARQQAALVEAKRLGEEAEQHLATVRASEEAFEREALKLADDTPVKQLEEMMVAETDAARKSILERAVQLKRERLGGTAAGGAVGTGGRRISLDPQAIAAEEARIAAEEAAEATAKTLRAAEREHEAILRAEEAAARFERDMFVQDTALRQAAGPGSPSPRFTSLRNAPGGSTLAPAAPATWTAKRGPAFWSQVIAEGAVRGASDAGTTIARVNQFVEGVRSRFGTFYSGNAARKTFVNQGFARTMNRMISEIPAGSVATDELRNLHMAYEAVAMQSVMAGGNPPAAMHLAEFIDAWKTRGAKSAVTIYGDEIMDAWEGAVLARPGTGVVPNDFFERTLVYANAMEFAEGSGARMSLFYLDDVSQHFPAALDDAKAYVAGLMKDELDTLLQRIVNSAPDLRTEEFKALLDTDLNRLALRLHGPLQDPAPFAARIELPQPRTAAQLVNYDGVSPAAMLSELETWVAKAGDLDYMNTQTVSELARMVAYEAMTQDSYDLAAKVASSLGRAPVGSKGHKAAVFFREQMNKEIDFLGYEGNPLAIAYDELADLAAGKTRIFRGIGGTRGGRPFSFYDDGTGGRAYGRGLYMTPDFTMADSYAQGPGYTGLIGSFTLKESAVLDFSQLHGDEVIWDACEQIVAEAALLQRLRPGPLTPIEAKSLRDAQEVQRFMQGLADEATAQGFIVPPDWKTMKGTDFWQTHFDGPDLWETVLADMNKGAMTFDTQILHAHGTRGNVQTIVKDVSYLSPEKHMVVNSIPYAGVTAARRATAQTAALLNEMGMSETAWLQSRLARNAARITDPKTTRTQRKLLMEEQLRIKAAQKHIRVLKGQDQYTVPRLSYTQALKAAESVRSRVAAVLPHKSIGHYAESFDQADVELLRDVHVALKSTDFTEPAIKELDDALDWFPVVRYSQLNDYVGQAIQKVQGKRRSSLGLRGPLNDELGDTALRTVRDTDPAILQAKEAAIAQWCADNHLPVLPTTAYDAMRTVLQPAISRNIRTKLLIDEAFHMPGDYTDNFLALRAAKAEQNGVDNIVWTLNENPGMTVEEAATQFELSWMSGPGIKHPHKVMSESHERLLKRFFEDSSGKSVDDLEGVRAALSAHDTKPPWDAKYSFREHMERIGEWSPRNASQVDDFGGVWSLDEERLWFEQRYGQAPAWVTDSRLADGSAFMNRESYYQTMVDTGNYNEQVRIEARLAEDAGNDVATLAHGDEARGVKPVKDWEQERAWAVSRYGDRVGEFLPDGTVKLKAMPWLMNDKELAELVMSGVNDFGEVIWKADEVLKLKEAMGKLALKYADQFEKATGTLDASQKMIPSSLVNEYAYHMMAELGTTVPWKSLSGRILRSRNLLDMWSAVWSGVIIGNPAWIASNLVDNPTKAGFFSAVDHFARHASQEANDLIPSIKALGISSTGFFERVAESRGIMTRLGRGTSYGNIERAGVLWDALTLKVISQPLVGGTEMKVKTWLARRIFTGMKEELGPQLAAKGMSEDLINQALLFRTKKRIEALFPSLDNAGVAERLLNKVFPFVSYNFKNQIVWLTAVLDHPWMLDILANLQGALITENKRMWEADHPGERMPEHLFSQIRIPGTEMFLDLSMFSDSARGARLVTSGKTYNVQELLYSVFRVLPAQTAALASVGYNLFGIGGRLRWDKVFDENGLWTGEYEEVIVPPGTPWGDKPFDFIKDQIWVASFADTVSKALGDGDLTYPDVVRILLKLVTFGEVSEPSRYFMLNQQYFVMEEANPDLAEQWLNNTPEGRELKSLWDARNLGPTTTGLPPVAFSAAADAHPSALEIRKMWLNQQSPEMKALFNDAWQELEWAKEFWDSELDAVPVNSEAYDRLWTLRRTWYTQYYGSHPYLWTYIGMGMNPTEYIQDVGKMHQDDMMGQFKALFGYDQRPDDPVKAKQWEKDREDYLLANPEVAQVLIAETNAFERSINQVNESWDKALALSAAAEKIRDIGYELDKPIYRQAAQGISRVVNQTLEIEAAGMDPDARTGFRSKLDMLGLRLRKAGGDPEAEAEVFYGQRMQAVRVRAKNDPLKWHQIINENPDLRAQYFAHHPEKALTWEKQGRMLRFWDRFGRLADKGHWDAAWEAWDELPEGLKDYWQEQNPKGYKEFVKDARYSAAMGKWHDLFGTKGRAAAYAYFDSLPKWMRDRYYENHQGAA